MEKKVKSVQFAECPKSYKQLPLKVSRGMAICLIFWGTTHPIPNGTGMGIYDLARDGFRKMSCDQEQVRVG